MAKKSRTGVLKRQREAKKAERAAHKREKRERRGSGDSQVGAQVATADDLAGYGFVEDEPGREEEPHPPPRRALR